METSKELTNKKVAILATDGFEQSELFEPKAALEKAGAEIDIISLKSGEIKAWAHGDWGKTLEVDKLVTDVKAEDYDALMIPGGVINSDKLRAESSVVKFVTDFIEAGKPIAAICHAPWVLVETGLVKTRTLTSWPSLKTDIENAGALWVDREVVTDNGWVTSRKPDDIPAFNKEMIEEFAEGKHSIPVKTQPSARPHVDRLN